MALFNNPFANAPNQGVSNQPGQQPPVVIPGSKQDTNTQDNIDPTTGKPKVVDDLNNQRQGDTPLLEFGKLWENAPDDPNNPKPAQDTGYLPKIDPAKLQEVVGKIDYSKHITPEQQAAITAGGEGATKALIEVLNTTSRQTLMTAFTAATKMVETGLTNAKSKFASDVPSQIKDIIIANGLKSSNAIMNDPAYSPMVDMVRTRFQEKFTKATPAEIESAVNQYFNDMVGTITKAKNPAASKDTTNTAAIKTGDPMADWEKWFGGEPVKDSGIASA